MPSFTVEESLLESDLLIPDGGHISKNKFFTTRPILTNHTSISSTAKDILDWGTKEFRDRVANEGRESFKRYQTEPVFDMNYLIDKYGVGVILKHRDGFRYKVREFNYTHYFSGIYIPTGISKKEMLKYLTDSRTKSKSSKKDDGQVKEEFFTNFDKLTKIADSTVEFINTKSKYPLEIIADRITYSNFKEITDTNGLVRCMYGDNVSFLDDVLNETKLIVSDIFSKSQAKQIETKYDFIKQVNLDEICQCVFFW